MVRVAAVPIAMGLHIEEAQCGRCEHQARGDEQTVPHGHTGHQGCGTKCEQPPGRRRLILALAANPVGPATPSRRRSPRRTLAELSGTSSLKRSMAAPFLGTDAGRSLMGHGQTG